MYKFQYHDIGEKYHICYGKEIFLREFLILCMESCFPDGCRNGIIILILIIQSLIYIWLTGAEDRQISPSALPFLFFTCKRVGTQRRRCRRPHRMSMRGMSLSTLKLLYTGCSTYNCYLELYSDTENAFVALNLHYLRTFLVHFSHSLYI